MSTKKHLRAKKQLRVLRLVVRRGGLLAQDDTRYREAKSELAAGSWQPATDFNPTQANRRLEWGTRNSPLLQAIGRFADGRIVSQPPRAEGQA